MPCLSTERRNEVKHVNVISINLFRTYSHVIERNRPWRRLNFHKNEMCIQLNGSRELDS